MGGQLTLTTLVGSQKLITVVVHPAANVIFDRESLRRAMQELRGQRKSVHFQRHSEMRSGLDEALDPQFGITLEPKDLDLGGVHERVNKGPLRPFLVEDNDVEKRQRIHVRDLGGLEAEGASLGEKVGNGHAGAAQLDDADLIEQRRGEIRPHQSLLLGTERTGSGEIVFTLLLQVSR